MTRPEMQDPEKTPERTGFIHVAFSAGSKEAVDELTMRLKQDGYEVASGPRTTGDGYYESCVVGIEGNRIAIHDPGMPAGLFLVEFFGNMRHNENGKKHLRMQMTAPVFSARFYVLYLLGGLSDAIDGMVARKLGQASDFGAKLDTIADFIFAIAVFVKIAGVVHVPAWLMAWVVLIIVIKIMNVIAGLLKQGKFVTVHSTLNKVCGGIIFLLPLILGGGFSWQKKAAAAVFASLIATAAAIAESIVIMNQKGGHCHAQKRQRSYGNE